MPGANRFEDLEAWKKSRELVTEIYKISLRGPLNRDFGLKNQLCRAAVSSMSNIAEGFTRNSDKDFAHFLDIARASLSEVKSLLYVALDVEYIEKDSFQRLYVLAESAQSLIGGLISYLRQSART